MIKKEKIAPDSLENILLEPMSKLAKQEMTKYETHMMVSVILAEKEGRIDEMYEELKKVTWSLKAVEKRVDIALTANIDKATQVFLVMFLNGNIGRCVIYLYYIQWWAKKNNKRDITFDVFTENIFPWGFPSADDILPLWSAQKMEGINLIDVPAASKSIQFS